MRTLSISLVTAILAAGFLGEALAADKKAELMYEASVGGQKFKYEAY